MLGDFNITVTSSDVGDPDFMVPGVTHTSEPERVALQDFLTNARLSDVVRPLDPEGFTFWDYKQGKFQKNHGLRIDFIFGSEDFAQHVVAGQIMKDERRKESPSDHVPVVVELALEDDDDRPMVF